MAEGALPPSLTRTEANRLRVAELRERLGALGESTDGLKKALVERLLGAQERPAAARGEDGAAEGNDGEEAAPATDEAQADGRDGTGTGGNVPRADDSGDSPAAMDVEDAKPAAAADEEAAAAVPLLTRAEATRLRVAELRERLGELGESTDGLKKALVERLIGAQERLAAARGEDGGAEDEGAARKRRRIGEEEKPREETAEGAAAAAGAEAEPAAVWKKGDACEARYFDDGHWYRATIVKVIRDKSGKPIPSGQPAYRVHFTDYGNKEEVTADEVRPLKKDINEVHLFAGTLKGGTVKENEKEVEVHVPGQPVDCYVSRSARCFKSLDGTAAADGGEDGDEVFGLVWSTKGAGGALPMPPRVALTVRSGPARERPVSARGRRGDRAHRRVADARPGPLSTGRDCVATQRASAPRSTAIRLLTRYIRRPVRARRRRMAPCGVQDRGPAHGLRAAVQVRLSLSPGRRACSGGTVAAPAPRPCARAPRGKPPTQLTYAVLLPPNAGNRTRCTACR